MSSFIQINDIHLSDTPPRNRTDTYQDDVFDKLEYSFGLASDGILLMGDLFHHQHPSRTTFALISRLWEMIERHNKPVYVIVGNHDVYAGRVDLLDAQPLGMIIRHPNVRWLNDGVHNIDGVEIAAVNWDYGMERDGVDLIKERLGDVRPDLLLTHAPILDSGNPFFSTISYSKLAGLAKSIAWGHIHELAPAKQREGTYFSNPGALSRRTLHGLALEEPDSQVLPHIARLTFDGSSNIVEYVPVPCRPMSEAYLASSVVEKVTAVESDALDSFIDTLEMDELSAVSPERLRTMINTTDASPEVRVLLDEVLNQ